MKNVYVSVDIEGIWGVASKYSTGEGHPEYVHARENMINETNLVIEELYKNGVENIVVNDSHGSMDNLIPQKLNPNVSIVTGNSIYKSMGMMEGISKDFDCCMFIGYHTREGTADSMLNHTTASKYVHKVELNGAEAGETMLNTHAAWYYNVPVALVAGDDKYIEQSLKEFNGKIATVATKKSINRETAINIPYNKLKQEYEAKIKQALSMKDFFIGKKDHYEIKITYHTENAAYFVSNLPTVNRISSKTISISGKDYLELRKLYRMCVSVCYLLQ